MYSTVNFRDSSQNPTPEAEPRLPEEECYGYRGGHKSASLLGVTVVVFIVFLIMFISLIVSPNKPSLTAHQLKLPYTVVSML